MAAEFRFAAVLFDLDGTLIDTAPDMVGALQQVLRAEGHEPIDYAIARSYVSNGSAGLVRLAFPDVDDERHERLRAFFLDVYEREVCVDSGLFPGLDQLLNELDEAGTPWGIVTNKPERMTTPLVAALGLNNRAGSVISGDTIPQRKPDPTPLILACERLGVEPRNTVYVGDAARDIDAGKAAGMHTIAAGWGYITPDDDAEHWKADELVAEPEDLARRLRKHATLDSA